MNKGLSECVFVAGGYAQGRKMCFPIQGQQILDFLPPEAMPKIEQMTFQIQGRNIPMAFVAGGYAQGWKARVVNPVGGYHAQGHKNDCSNPRSKI